MTDPAAPWPALMHIATWEYRTFDTGPLASLLMHVVADPAALLRDGENGAARANVRLVLRGGTIIGTTVTAPRVAMPEIQRLAARTLAQHRYDESRFRSLETAIAAALRAAGMPTATIALEQNATLLPRPLLMPDQLGRMALQAGNDARSARGEPALAASPPALLACLREACSFHAPAVLAYLAARDPEALAYRAHAREVLGATVDRLAVHNLLAAPPGNARNRAQALRALPWLLPLMTAPGEPWSGVVYILHAIDAGAPLHDAIARAFNVPREVVRWVSRRTLPAIWSYDARRLTRLLTLLGWLAPERRPQTFAQFERLNAWSTELAAPLAFGSAASKTGDTAALARIAGCMRHWLAQEDEEGATAPDPFRLAMLELRDAQDFLRALFDSARAIDGLDDAGADAWVLRWCATIRVSRLMALSRNWHAAILSLSGADTEDAGSPRLPPVLAAPRQFASRTIVELTTTTQLVIEGQLMAHCVGSYAYDCHHGNSIIVSLRTATGIPVSTVELHLVGEPLRVVVAQHRAARNAAPDSACSAALAALVRHLQHPDQQADLATRRAYQLKEPVQSSQPARVHSPGFKYSASAQHVARALALPAVAA